MRIIHPHGYLRLGANVRYLYQCEVGQVFTGKIYYLAGLKSVKSAIDEIGFPVSKSLFSTRLEPILKKLSDLETAAKGNDVALDQEVATELGEAAIEFEHTLLAEAMTRFIAVPIQGRIQWEHLINNPEALLGDGVYALLSDQAKRDWSDGCRALAMESATGAAFHVLRCLEECVREIFRKYYPRKKIANRSWGQLTTELRQKKNKPKPAIVLLGHLDHLREHFRNPTDHPEKFYQVEEAEDLLHLAADAIGRCVHEIWPLAHLKSVK